MIKCHIAAVRPEAPSLALQGKAERGLEKAETGVMRAQSRI